MKNLEFARTIGSVQVEHPIMGGAGLCKNIHDVRKLETSAASAVTVGSITKKFRHEDETQPSSNDFILNSRGFANKGADYYHEHLQEMAQICHNENKKLIVNVTAIDDLDEYLELYDLAIGNGADLVELNFVCPNVTAEQNPKLRRSIISHNLKAMDYVINALWSSDRGLEKVIAKVSPYRRDFIDLVAAIFNDHFGLAGVSITSNGQPVNGPDFPKVSEQAFEWRRYLPKTAAVIAAGGINSGSDIVTCLLAGTTAVQVTSAYFSEGPQAFSRLLMELDEFYHGSSARA